MLYQFNIPLRHCSSHQTSCFHFHDRTIPIHSFLDAVSTFRTDFTRDKTTRPILKVPKYGKHSFPSTASKLWNTLPKDTRFSQLLPVDQQSRLAVYSNLALTGVFVCVCDEQVIPISLIQRVCSNCVNSLSMTVKHRKLLQERAL